MLPGTKFNGIKEYNPLEEHPTQPKDVDLSGRLVGLFNSSENEQVATNLIFLAKRQGGWQSFSMQDYASLFNEPATEDFRDNFNKCLDYFLTLEFLYKNQNRFYFNKSFVDKLPKKFTL